MSSKTVETGRLSACKAVALIVVQADRTPPGPDETRSTPGWPSRKEELRGQVKEAGGRWRQETKS